MVIRWAEIGAPQVNGNRGALLFPDVFYTRSVFVILAVEFIA